MPKRRVVAAFLVRGVLATIAALAFGGMRGDVFFVSPDGSWEADVHALVVTIDDERIVKLPVWLR